MSRLHWLATPVAAATVLVGCGGSTTTRLGAPDPTYAPDPTEWVDESRVPATTNPGYGLQWWLGPNGRTFQAEGLVGQRIVVVPGLDVVIAANSTAGGDPYPMIETVRALFAGEPAPSTLPVR
jgi:CubicO group peptidase (beta-lactamase class C family)